MTWLYLAVIGGDATRTSWRRAAKFATFEEAVTWIRCHRTNIDAVAIFPPEESK